MMEAFPLNCLSDPPSVPVSIIVPQHGRPELTEQAVRSFLTHHHCPVELIVVEDGGVPGQLAALPALQAGQTLRSLRLPVRQGVTAAWNAGARTAQGEILVFLNNDTLTWGAWLEDLTAGLNCQNVASRGVAMVGVEWRPAMEVSAAVRRRLEISSLLAGWCFALRRTTWNCLGGVDEHFRLYFSDTDLQLRCLTQFPGALQVVPGLKLRHAAHATTSGFARRRKEWREDSQIFRRRWV